jgi:two-component system response regulator DesR
MVQSEADFEVRTTPWQQAAEEARDAKADVCVVDTDSPVYSRLAAVQALVRELQHAGTALLVLAREGRPGLLRQAAAARALGYVSKDATRERLLAAIRLVADGKRFVDEGLAPDFLEAAEPWCQQDRRGQQVMTLRPLSPHSSRLA